MWFKSRYWKVFACCLQIYHSHGHCGVMNMFKIGPIMANFCKGNFWWKKALQCNLFWNVTDVNKQADNRKLMWCVLNGPTGQWVLTVRYDTNTVQVWQPNILTWSSGWGGGGGGCQGANWPTHRLRAPAYCVHCPQCMHHTVICCLTSDTAFIQDVLPPAWHLSCPF